MPGTSTRRRGSDALARYYRAVAELGHDPGNLGFYASHLFRHVALRGARMLDVGAGDGRFSFYAACAGAARVVALEPDAAGSSSGKTGRAFLRLAEALEDPVVELVRDTLQEYRHAGELFDVVLMHASINHLDEDACVRLHEDAAAREAYGRLFARLAELVAPGGTLIAVDCHRRNLFGDLGVRNPISPRIEWEKHQSPALWARLLGEAGFVDPRVDWNTFNTLRTPGRVLLANRVASYLTISSFRLTMHRAAAA